MGALRRLGVRVLRTVKRNESEDAELRAEMQAHLEMEIDENIRRGMSPSEARRRAMIASGGMVQAAERVHAERAFGWIEDIVADTRFAIRQFRRTPLSTATIVLVLSLGIGTNVVLFTILNSVATMPAPGIARDASLVRVRGTLRQPRIAGVQARAMSWPEVQEYAARSDVFSSVAAYAWERATVVIGAASETPVSARVIYATSNYFSTLGVRPAAGSVAASDGLRISGAPEAVISDLMWRRYFGAARDVIGRTVRINDTPVQIVGVAPPDFNGTEGSDAVTLWTPLAAYPLLQNHSAAVFSSPDSAFLWVAARLRSGVTARTAAPVVTAIAQRMKVDADVVPMLASNLQPANRADFILSAAAGGSFGFLVLLITCTNVSVLMVGLAVARGREVSVRLSLGAPRGRLIRQLLTESLLLAMISAACCLLVTTAGVHALQSSMGDVPLVVDWHVVLITCAVAAVTGLLFGVSPALHATRAPVAEVLRGSSRSLSGSSSRLQRALVITQVALTQPLLVGLGITIATTMNEATRFSGTPGADHIAQVELDTWSANVTEDQRAARIDQLVARVATVPGVIAAMPMQMGTDRGAITVHSADRAAGVVYDSATSVEFVAAPMHYFRIFSRPIVAGRDFNDAERVHASNDASRPIDFRAVIVTTDFARRMWGSASPVGRRLVIPSSTASPPMVVVGLVADAPARAGEQARVYVPYARLNTGVIVRTTVPAAPVIDDLRKAAADVVPDMPVFRAATLEQRESEMRNVMMKINGAVGAGGLIALLLSAVALYAVVSFGVNQRTREIGIRTALGAQQSHVVAMFFRGGFRLSAIGLVVGLPLSYAVSRFILVKLGWPVTTTPFIALIIGGMVMVVASIAVGIPAKRASSIDPVLALRAE